MSSPAQHPAQTLHDSQDHHLHPTLHQGLFIWTPRTLLLHFLWLYQFIIALISEYLIWMVQLIFSIGRPAPVDPITWLIVALNTLLIFTIIIEVCLFANSGMTKNLYLGLQVLKTTYFIVMYVVMLEKYISKLLKDYFTLDLIWISFLFLIPWLVALGYALVMKSRQWKNKKAGIRRKSTIIVTVTPADEETALLG